MFLLDTNVVSELRKAKAGEADRNLTSWAHSVSPAALFVSAITIMELEMGVRLTERRDKLQGAILRAWFENHVLPAFKDRVLAVDSAVARCRARLDVPARRFDRNALIAATALVHGMTVATSNGADFSGTGVRIFNPWAFGA
jgi:predicted nucleic acid-binding protein